MFRIIFILSLLAGWGCSSTGSDNSADSDGGTGTDGGSDTGGTGDTDSSSDRDSAILLFSSGFEDNVTVVPGPYDDYRNITGRDNETGFSWPIDILGASESGLHFIDDDSRQAIDSRIETVTGHNGTKTKALYSEENYEMPSPASTQCPYEILDITDGRRDLYVRYWMKVDRDSLSMTDKWRALFEWKTKDYADGTGFRLIAYIYTDENGNPYWHWQGDADPEHPVWEIDNFDVPVEGDKWFLTEYYWHWSEESDGRALWKINGQVIGDHHGPTTRNSKPIDFIMLTQIYGDGNPKYQWVDDIEIWDAFPALYN